MNNHNDPADYGHLQPPEETPESPMSLLHYLSQAEVRVPALFGRKAGSRYDQVNETLVLTQLAMCVDSVARKFGIKLH